MPGRDKPGSLADVEGLRLRMFRLGASTEMIAGEIGRRFGYRPRQAYRLAQGWEPREAAERFNALVQSKGSEHAGRDTMTPSRISEFERWPDSTRKPLIWSSGFWSAVDVLP